MHIFSTTKNWRISDINIRNFNETLTNDVGSFEQLDPGCGKIVYLFLCVTESPIMDDFDDHSEGSRKVITWAGFQTLILQLGKNVMFSVELTSA